MKRPAKLIEEFASMGSPCALSLLDGAYYEGYILEFAPDYFEFGLGGPMAPDEPVHIKYEDVNLSKLSFFDEKQRCWRDACWDSQSKKWSVSKSE